MNQQLILDLGHRVAVDRVDFLVSDCNVQAVEWVDRWPDWPARALVIWGPPASGKTHLGHVWCAKSNADYITAKDLRAEDAAGLRDRNAFLFLDDADQLAGDSYDEEALLHLYNYMLETDGALLLAAEKAPAFWPVALADLSSRMKALQGVGIAPPDDRLLAALLEKQFLDRQLRVGEEVVNYLVPRMERSFVAVSKIVAAIDTVALERLRPVTVPLVREVLDQLVT
ncbi:MAG: DnaA/Hda family protein [Alphaproteobacteria bacterium]|nr:DnaA/Hda family protein [Alphaproteobacteria bacterium]